MYYENYQSGNNSNKLASKLNMFPEALIYSYKSLDARENVFEVGLVLMDKKLLARPKNVQSANWKIGVDFGTTSTMLYFRENKAAARPLVLQSHLFKITESGGARAQLFENFIPDTKYQDDGSFLSIFHLLHAAEDIRPLIDGHVFMLKSDNTRIFERLKQDIDANLKWKGDETGKAKTKAYIGQICLQALLEAAGAYYFNKLHNDGTNFAQGAVCIDIGAGTTDITIINEQPGCVIYHISIKSAVDFSTKSLQLS